MAGSNADQVAFWGGDAGNTWVAQQAAMDALLLPVLNGVLARSDIRTGARVLDVGCGTGQSTIAAGALVGADGHVLGADVSEPMLGLARMRAADDPQVTFDCVDVADHDFSAAPFDNIISRFGVMFFADTTAAFANMTRALKPRGKMSFATWGTIAENPWFTLPARVARDMFGPVPKSDPDGPGPFAMRDSDKAETMLRNAGLHRVQSEAVDLTLTLAGGPAAIAELCMHIGPAVRAMTDFEVDASGRAKLLEALTSAFADLPDHAVPAQINFFTAVRP